MSKITFDTHPNYWTVLEKAIPGAKESIEEIYLVLRLMNTYPKIRAGRKRNHKKKNNLADYYKYMIDANDKKQLTVYIYTSSDNPNRIRFYHIDNTETLVYISNLEDLKIYLSDWLVNF